MLTSTYPDRCPTRTKWLKQSLTPLVFLCFFLSALFSGPAFAQTCPDLQCTANDVQITSVYLGNAAGTPLSESCNPGTPQTAYLYLVVSTNAPRNGVFISADLNGQALSNCFSNSLQGNNNILQYPTPISYTCGTTLTLTNIFVAYTAGQDNFCTTNPTGNCAEIIPSKCSKPAPIVVRAPLVANFTASGACPTPGQAFQTFTFTSTTTGGRAPYSYTYNFGDGTSVTTTNNSVTHTYTSGGSKSVTLTVTDADGRVDAETKTITVAACCQFTVACPTPANRDLGSFNCTNLANIPAHPTNEATAEAAPYNLVIGNNPCGTIRVSSADDATPNVCSPSNQTITRTVTIYDDLDGDNVRDAGEPSESCTFTYVVVADKTGPTFTAPAAASVSCASDVPAANVALITDEADNCGGTVTMSHVGDVTTAGSCANRYTITRTYRATDACGNTTDHTQTITVNDQTPPVITCPTNRIVQCGSSTATSATGMATATDNCGGTVTVTYTDQTGTVCTNGTYTITRTFTATDVCGNSSQCSQTITVNTTANLECHDVNLVNRVFDGTNTTFSFNVCAKNCAALSNMAFAIPRGMVVISPANGSTYDGSFGKYRVSVPISKNVNGIKFDVIGEGIKNSGECDVFTFTLAGNQQAAAITVITKAGNKSSDAIVDPSCLCQQSNAITNAAPQSRVNTGEAPATANLSVAAYPNPFNDRVKFTIRTSVAGQASLEVFNMLGQKVKTLYQGYLPVGRQQVIDFTVPEAQRTNLIYLFRVGEERVSGKLLNSR